MPHKRAPAALTLMVTMSLLASSCGSSDRRITTSTTTPSRVSEAHLKAEVLAAYNTFLIAFEQALERADPTFPKLEETTTGKEKSRLKAYLQQLRSKGQIAAHGHRSRLVGTQKVRLLTGHHATVTECRVDTGVILNRQSQQVVDNSVVSRRLIATLDRTGSRWRVSSASDGGRWKGVSGCAILPSP